MITQEKVRARFSYDQLTGVMTWKHRPRSDFKTLRGWAIWNGRYAGKSAGSRNKRDDVMGVAIDNKKYILHRLIWLYMTGKFPEQVDHINHRKYDNRWANLRDVSDLQNKRNLPMLRTNTTGAVGVIWDRRRSVWRAQISVQNKCKYIGSFGSFDDAKAARKTAEEKYGFHANHGAAK